MEVTEVQFMSHSGIEVCLEALPCKRFLILVVKNAAQTLHLSLPDPCSDSSSSSSCLRIAVINSYNWPICWSSSMSVSICLNCRNRECSQT